MHTKVDEGKKVYCLIPNSCDKGWCDESDLRSKWARMQHKFYKAMAVDWCEMTKRIARRNAEA